MHIVDLSNPTQPVEVGRFSIPIYVNDIAVAGDYVYLAAGSAVGELAVQGLHILDVSNPVAPREAGMHPMIRWPRSIALAGGYVYLLANDGLHIIDVSDPAHLSEVGSYPMSPSGSSGFSSVEVIGRYAYVAESRSLRIIDVSSVDSPREVRSYPLPDRTNGTTSDGRTVYVADGEGGLFMFRHTDGVPPRIIEVPAFYLDAFASSGDTTVYLGRVLDVANAQIEEGQSTTLTIPFSGTVGSTCFTAALTLSMSAFESFILSMDRFHITVDGGPSADVSRVGTVVMPVGGTLAFSASATQNVPGVGDVVFTFTGQVQTTQ